MRYGPDDDRRPARLDDGRAGPRRSLPALRRPGRRDPRRGPRPSGPPGRPCSSASRRPAASSRELASDDPRGAIDAGLDVLSGLHTFIGDDPEFAAAAAASGARIVDYRRPPDRMETVGRPAARAGQAGDPDRGHRLRDRQDVGRARARRGRPPRRPRRVFVPTGQTGMMIEGWGVAVDRLISDFIKGTTEWLVEQGEERGDWIFVEGQGSLDHPAYSRVTLGLIHGATPARHGHRPQAGPRRARLRPPARGVVPDRPSCPRSSSSTSRSPASSRRRGSWPSRSTRRCSRTTRRPAGRSPRPPSRDRAARRRPVPVRRRRPVRRDPRRGGGLPWV